MKKFVSILLAFVMIITITSCANTAQPDWQDHLDLGQKYLLDGDYEQAIIEFNKVIEIEPKNVDAYLGLAEAYIAAGDYDSAISVLEQGYAETSNQTLQDRINELMAMSAAQTEAVTTVSETISDPTTTPEDIENNTSESQKILQVSLGFDHSAAITEDGSLYMWGSNEYGQLGNGTTEDSYVPIKIMDNVVFADIGDNAISTGNATFNSAAVTIDGSLYMWGENYCGFLGNGISGGDTFNYDEGIDSNLPIKILDNIASVSIGNLSCGAIAKEGSLYMWGWNWDGQLGDGTDEDSNVPVKIMENVISVSLGADRNAAITTDGSLYMWGSGQLGNGTHRDSNVPIKIMDNVASICLDFDSCAAITKDGSLYMWGKNDVGRFGNGRTEYYSLVPLKIMDNVVSVSLRYDVCAAITADGSLYMWGDNNYGLLGNGMSGGEYDKYDEGIDSNVPIKIMDNVVSVSLEFDHVAAITKDGSLYTWGDGVGGQLGNGTDESSNIPVKIMDNVASVCLGEHHSAAITKDGSLYMWGWNWDGQLGNGTTEESNVPIKIEIPAE